MTPSSSSNPCRPISTTGCSSWSTSPAGRRCRPISAYREGCAGPDHGPRVLRPGRGRDRPGRHRRDPAEARPRDDLLSLRRRSRRAPRRRDLAPPAAAVATGADAGRDHAEVGDQGPCRHRPGGGRGAGGALRPAGRAGGRRSEPAGRHRHGRRHHRRRQGGGHRGPVQAGRAPPTASCSTRSGRCASPASACRRCCSASSACSRSACCCSTSSCSFPRRFSCSPSCR